MTIFTTGSLITATGVQQLENSFAGAQAPANPVTGQLWYDIPNTTLRIYNGASWISVSGSGGGVTSITAGTGISVSGSTGDVTITATGFVNTAGAVGSVMRVTRADGAVFSYNTTIAGSSLRRLGVLLANTNFLNLNTSISGTISVPNIGNLTTYPVPTFDFIQVDQSLSGTWLSLGTIGTVAFSYTDAGVYGYLSAYQTIHLAVRIA